MNYNIIHLILFIVVFIILYFEVVYPIIIILFIFYFSIFDIKYALITLLLYMLYLNNNDMLDKKEEIEKFIGVNNITNALCKTQAYKSVKKYVKKKGKEIIKSIQEEENEKKEEEEQEEEEEVENFSNRKKKKKNITLEQLKKNYAADDQLENFQTSIKEKLGKINNILTEIKK